MSKGYVIYNPLAGNGSSREDALLLEMLLDEELVYYDMTRITNYAALLGSMSKTDRLIIVGGDGTLNRFINATSALHIPQDILYFPAGTGNDFAKDLGKDASGPPFSIKEYIQELPSVTVNGNSYRFINGVGFGIDGYCCQVGDQLKKIPGKKVNYTGIAIKGLLFHFQARNAKVAVDGKTYEYKKVWIAPTMLGRYYGGGMMPAPSQDRESKKLSVMLFHGAGRLRTLCAFPGIFSGKHIKHTKMVAIHSGYEIKVEFDRPTALQVDGETILDVTSYTATAAAINNKREEKLHV